MCVPSRWSKKTESRVASADAWTWWQARHGITGWTARAGSLSDHEAKAAEGAAASSVMSPW